MKTRILSLVMVMTFLAGVATAQGALPKGYQNVVLQGNGTTNNEILLSA